MLVTKTLNILIDLADFKDEEPIIESGNGGFDAVIMNTRPKKKNEFKQQYFDVFVQIKMVDLDVFLPPYVINITSLSFQAVLLDNLEMICLKTKSVFIGFGVL